MRQLRFFDANKIFIDANIFIYIFKNDWRTEHCKTLIDGIVDFDINGYISYSVLREVIQFLIIDELRIEYNITEKIIKSDPEYIDFEELRNYKEGFEYIKEIKNLEILTIDDETFSLATEFVGKYNLLLPDAIHAATCKLNEIEDIATNDDDFERVDFLTVWKP
ncbi:MAG: hypothetical protein A7316_01425 [Candidatus Altiarchaeales archaeon WOR_SM1_86-2]|nr:MAG: hypothetical protein A7316_01425 [Candidatus Altiarchaeales archaeon WOR_SM1_86-2]